MVLLTAAFESGFFGKLLLPLSIEPRVVSIGSGYCEIEIAVDASAPPGSTAKNAHCEHAGVLLSPSRNRVCLLLVSFHRRSAGPHIGTRYRKKGPTEAEEPSRISPGNRKAPLGTGLS